MPASDGLVAFWKLGEASGTRVDFVGNNDLTDVNTVTQATGKIGDAAQFVAANSEYLDIVDNTDMSTGDIDFTFSAWVYLDSLGANRGVLSKDTVAIREYGLFVNAGNTVAFQIFTPASAVVTVTATTFGALSTATWYHVLAWHDATADTINISINNTAAQSTANSAGVKDSTEPFRIGRQAGNHWDGRIDAVGFWKRVLTADERAEVYNSGNGWEPTNDQTLSVSVTATPSLTKQMSKTLSAVGSWVATLTATFLAAFRPTVRIAEHPANTRTAEVPVRESLVVGRSEE